MAIYRKRCDQCHVDYKRGLRMDLLINKITVLSGKPHWDTYEDEEYFASFCSKECLISFVVQQLGGENSLENETLQASA